MKKEAQLITSTNILEVFEKSRFAFTSRFFLHLV